MCVGDREQLGSDDSFGGCGLVDVEVRSIGANDGAAGPLERCECEHISAGSVPHEQGLDRLAEQIVKGASGGLGVRIVAVGERVAVVGVPESVKHCGVSTRRVVGGQ